MKIIIINIFFILITSCSEPKYPFASFMRIEIKPYIYCDGLVRNYLVFGYYQIDNLLCNTETGSTTLPSKIVHESTMKQYWDHFDDYHYSPAREGLDFDRRYFRIGPQKWMKAETHTIILK